MTIVVKIILLPLSYKAFKSQREQQFLAPKIKEIKKQYPDQKEQSAKLMELYKEHKTNPFSGCLVLLIQLPILIGIYRVFLIDIAAVGALAYPFIHVPSTLSGVLFGLSLSKPSIVIGVLAGVTQLIQVLLSPVFKKQPGTTNDTPGDFSDRMTESMQGSMKWTMPIMMGFIGSIIPSAVSVYLVVSNIFTVLQEQLFILIEKKQKAKQTVMVKV
jgi:YidC/Oxa1 family membrane protein insertase